MTVSLVTTIQRWIGLSTDTKPTSAPEGSTFFETNTGQGWVWDESNWVEDISMINAFSQALKEWNPKPTDIGTIIGDGRKIVTTAATPEKLSTSSIPISNVIIQAESDNGGTIVVGGTTVIAALATRRGVALNAGDSISVNVADLNLIWLDATVNGEGVTYFWTRL